MHRFEQAGASPASAQSAQLVLKRRVRGLHPAFEFGKVK